MQKQENTSILRTYRMSNSVCVCENKKPLGVLAFSYFHEKGNTPLSQCWVRGHCEIQEITGGERGAAGSSFQRLCQGTEATV